MSHNLFSRSMLSCARNWAFLEKVDAVEADRSRSEGCGHCGGRLHSATYPRKPHALAPALRDDVRRFSFCCEYVAARDMLRSGRIGLPRMGTLRLAAT